MPTSSSFAGEFAPGHVLIGRYRIVALLGEGGMGQVYLAEDLVLGQPVAVKFLPAHLAEEGLERFRAEVRHAREVTHPNVARVHDIGEVDGRHFLTMEFVDGEDLASLVRRIGRLPREKASEIAQQVCAGLAEAHRKGVLHRDLKPANVMLDGEGHVRITDFGLAVSADDGAATLAGTPQYMAPEQLAGAAATTRSEVYSLGLLLYELYTGKRALRGKTLDELRREHEEGGPDPPSSVLAGLDPAVDAVLARCLARDPAIRPASVVEVARALPGGDPLAAAVAAGETPSPELVASADDAGGVRPRNALAIAAAIVALLLALAAVTERTKVLPSESPERLAFIAEDVLSDLGYEDLPRNDGIGLERNSVTIEPPPRKDGGWPPPYVFWRRWSPGSLAPRDFHDPDELQFRDPPQSLPGSASVALDTTGRLIYLAVVPEPEPAAEARGRADFAPLFERAGLDPAELEETEPVSLPPSYCDEVVAYETAIDGVPTIVQAGAYQARPVYFEVRGAEWSGVPPPENDVYSGTWLVVLACAVVAALRNLRRGRGDVRGATRFASLMIALYAGIELLAIRLPEHGPMTHVFNLAFGRAGAHAVLHAVHVWVMYVAVEPYVRRTWPRAVVGWVRLIAGRFKDPLVGREVLLGVLWGALLGAAVPMGLALFERLGAAPEDPLVGLRLGSMESPRNFIIWALYNVTGPMLGSLFIATLLVLTHALTRRAWATQLLSGSVTSVVLVSLLAGEGMLTLEPLPVALAVAVGMAFCWVFRFGFLAGFTALVVQRILTLTVVSTDLAAWYAPYTVAVFAIVLALTAWGAAAALSGTPAEAATTPRTSTVTVRP